MFCEKMLIVVVSVIIVFSVIALFKAKNETTFVVKTAFKALTIIAVALIAASVMMVVIIKEPYKTEKNMVIGFEANAKVKKSGGTDTDTIELQGTITTK